MWTKDDGWDRTVIVLMLKWLGGAAIAGAAFGLLGFALLAWWFGPSW